MVVGLGALNLFVDQNVKRAEARFEVYMRIFNAEWSPKVNFYIIGCSCGKTIKHRMDRWTVICGYCGRRENLQNLRDHYVQEGFVRLVPLSD